MKKCNVVYSQGAFRTFLVDDRFLSFDSRVDDSLYTMFENKEEAQYWKPLIQKRREELKLKQQKINYENTCKRVRKDIFENSDYVPSRWFYCKVKGY